MLLASNQYPIKNSVLQAKKESLHMQALSMEGEGAFAAQRMGTPRDCMVSASR